MFQTIGLTQHYQHWAKQATDPQAENYLSTIDVLKCHYHICDYFYQLGEGGLSSHGPLNFNLLDSAVKSQLAGYGGVLFYEKWKDRAACVFYKIAKNHAFQDANKRTAIMALIYFANRANRKPAIDFNELELLALRTARSELFLYPNYIHYTGGCKESTPESDVLFLAKYISKNFPPISAEMRTINFRQLDTILRKHGFFLDTQNARKNFVNVHKVVTITPSRFERIFGAKSKTEYRKITNIGFPGMNNEVPPSTIKKIREETKLTTRNGYDSSVFYGDDEPLPILLGGYHALLISLKDK